MRSGALLELIVQPKTAESVNITVPSGSTGEGRINWLEICRIPVVDALLSEPCETLTTPDGYTLPRKENGWLDVW